MTDRVFSFCELIEFSNRKIFEIAFNRKQIVIIINYPM